MADFSPGQRFGFVGPRGELVLDAASARLLNEIRAEIRRLSNLVGVPPVNVSEDGSGRRISIDLVTPPIEAKLSGTGAPYAFVQQYWTGTAWADLPGGLSGSNAYECNGVTGLAGKVVRLKKTLVDDWRFQYVRLGTAPTTAFHIQFTVTSTCQGVPAGGDGDRGQGRGDAHLHDGRDRRVHDRRADDRVFHLDVALAGYATQSGSGSVSAVGDPARERVAGHADRVLVPLLGDVERGAGPMPERPAPVDVACERRARVVHALGGGRVRLQPLGGVHHQDGHRPGCHLLESPSPSRRCSPSTSRAGATRRNSPCRSAGSPASAPAASANSSSRTRHAARPGRSPGRTPRHR
jgi:hypothetical protein